MDRLDRYLIGLVFICVWMITVINSVDIQGVEGRIEMLEQNNAPIRDTGE